MWNMEGNWKIICSEDNGYTMPYVGGIAIVSKMIQVVLGCSIVCAGVIFLSHAYLVTGGTTGIALAVSYVFDMPFSLALMLVSLPFYLLSLLRMGWGFTLSTFFAVAILSLFTEVNRWLPAFSLPGYIGAVCGGILIGLGLSVLFWNGSSLGGINVLALFLQKRFNLDPGKVTLVADSLIVLSCFYSVSIENGIYSILSVTIVSFIISYFKGKIAEKNLSRV